MSDGTAVIHLKADDYSVTSGHSGASKLHFPRNGSPVCRKDGSFL